jgi:hypothetical protein
MNSLSESSRADRLISAATWVLAIATGLTWIVALFCELQAVPEPLATAAAQLAANRIEQALPDASQPDSKAPGYWAQVATVASAR